MNIDKWVDVFGGLCVVLSFLTIFLLFPISVIWAIWVPEPHVIKTMASVGVVGIFLMFMTNAFVR